MVFEVDVAVEVGLQFGETGEERAVGVAGFGGRGEIRGQGAEGFEGFAGIGVFLHHGMDRPLQRHRDGFACDQASDGGEEDFFFFGHVGVEFLQQAGEDLMDFDQARRVSAVDAGDPQGHGVEARQFGAQVAVVAADDVFDQLDRWQFRRVVLFGWRAGEGGLQIGQNGIQRQVFRCAGLFDRASALAAEIQAMLLENARKRRGFGDEFAYGALG